MDFEGEEVNVEDLDDLEDDVEPLDSTTVEMAALIPDNQDGQETRPARPGSDASIWSFEYYQSFFDVDTSEVLERLRRGLWPFGSYFLKHVEGHGDLYGPFWVTTTLVFMLAMAGNVAHYFATPVDEKAGWHYDFRKVTVAATVIYSYVLVVPLGLWTYLRCRYASTKASVFDIFCLYGYTMALFVPVAFFCAMPFVNSLGRWVLMSVAFALTGATLCKNLFPMIRDASQAALVPLLLTVVACHVAVCAGFKLYFFQFSNVDN